MALTCKRCSRPNPPEAAYCYHDGAALVAAPVPGARLHTSLHPFATAFVFPTGRRCLNFEQLIRGCLDDWPGAVALLVQGQLESFFQRMGRIDLAVAARAAARSSNPSLALDELLARIPCPLHQDARLRVEPTTLNLEPLRVGEDRRFELLLSNGGSRLLHGTISSDCLWLGLGEDLHAPQRGFQFLKTQTVPVRVIGQHLRASLQPLEGQLLLTSNGGSRTIMVRAPVPVQPFPTGVLAGAQSPRQLVEKTRRAPGEAAALFESGAVAEWYRLNGWAYPVTGPVASGADAVRQLFRALGLSVNLPAPPPVPPPPVMPAAVPPVVPFTEGALAGARTPAELVEKARAAPQEAFPLIESGRVAAWYRQNGWTYPVQGPFAMGVDAVLQLLRASGLPLPTQAPPGPPPLIPFEEEPLAGARTPAELAAKARAAAGAAAPLFETGKVASWYRRNGWTYPVEGPCASGPDAVWQLLHALGVPAEEKASEGAPPVEAQAPEVRLVGPIGATLRHVLHAKGKGEAGSPVSVQATSDQPWLGAGETRMDSSGATIVLLVSAVPNRPGETLHARVNVTVNNDQTFVVPVTLVVGNPKSGAVPLAETGLPR